MTSIAVYGNPLMFRYLTPREGTETDAHLIDGFVSSSSDTLIPERGQMKFLANKSYIKVNRNKRTLAKASVFLLLLNSPISPTALLLL